MKTIPWDSLARQVKCVKQSSYEYSTDSSLRTPADSHNYISLAPILRHLYIPGARFSTHQGMNLPVGHDPK